MDTTSNYQTKSREQLLLTLTVGVVLPLLQAAVSGLLIGILSGVLIYLYGGALSLAVIIALSSSCIAWLVGMRWWRSAVTPPVESVPVQTSTEIIEPQSVRVELLSDGKRKSQYIDLPVNAQRLRVLARGLMDGANFTEAEWCGSDGEFTRAEFAKLRAEMLRRGLLIPNSPHSSARGFSLTRGGKAAMEYFAEI